MASGELKIRIVVRDRSHTGRTGRYSSGNVDAPPDLLIDLVRPVTVLAPTLSGNAAGRAMVFVELLSGIRPVVLAGPSSGPRWLPLASRGGIEVVDTGPSMLPSPALRRRLRDTTTIVVKPLFSSFGQWLLSRSRSPVILDIDDPELALAAMDLRTLVRSATRLDGLLAPVLIGQRSRADAITVASSALAQRYGGTVIPHARDARLFAEAASRSRTQARTELGLDAEGQLVVFVGTVRPHKGVDILTACASKLGGAQIVIVGSERPSGAPKSVSYVPPVSYRDAVRWLAAADVVAIPQRDGHIGRMQAPAKAIDALAVGRAIVASELPPLREVIGDAGLFVEHGSPDALAAGLNHVLQDDAMRVDLEERGRVRFLERYSLEAVRPTMLGVLHAAEAA